MDRDRGRGKRDRGKGTEGQRGRGAEIEEEGKAQRGRGAERWSHNIRTCIINHTASILCNYVYMSQYLYINQCTYYSVQKSQDSRFMIHAVLHACIF